MKSRVIYMLAIGSYCYSFACCHCYAPR